MVLPQLATNDRSMVLAINSYGKPIEIVKPLNNFIQRSSQKYINDDISPKNLKKSSMLIQRISEASNLNSVISEGVKQSKNLMIV
jgi:hypothetical protein